MKALLHPTACCESNKKTPSPSLGSSLSPLPQISASEVSQHNSAESLYVIYKNVVYDATEFCSAHPGGSGKLLLAGGKHLEPFWAVFKQHEGQEYVVRDVLASLPVVGELQDSDKVFVHKVDNPYIHEPVRTGSLKYHSVTPCNAECMEEGLRTFITDSDDYYIRHHGPVPIVEDKNGYEIDVGGMVLNLNKIETMIKERKIVTSTMQCGGNRRGTFKSHQKTSGTQWGVGAISTAKWEGVELRSVLRMCYTDAEISRFSHVHVEGMDGTLISIPKDRAMDPTKDVLLATRMNDEDITPDHGFPARLIVPGVVGVRNIKWVKKIALASEEADSMWQTGHAYKVLPTWVKKVEEVDVAEFDGMMEMQPQSATTMAKATKGGDTLVKGFAYSGGGRKIVKVEVSFDGGKSWKDAELDEGTEQGSGKSWAWTMWSYKGEGRGKVLCRATDEDGRGQPKGVEKIWNLRGLGCNAWHEREVDEEEVEEE
ncbi:hypothetical protein TrCOL_g88 [Triparma columacea]|uniref:Cytochrome b5 heme-binding domain-containing protein n=1 Tax=Triparma columacea TaxID=722753 RepID=A0A9W7L9N0_9STRA|nr:hypothetical protein TrCOL_g88 [Triparma columacea]